jgi:phosphatidate phosphatase APP1
MVRNILHRTAIQLERFADKAWKRKQSKSALIEPYIGHATRDATILRGRVLTSIRRGNPKPNQSALTNLRQMTSLFLTDEVANVTLICNDVTTQTDEEGYFTLTLPRTDQTGWVDYAVTISGSDETTACPVLIPDPDAKYIVISDIDDTVLKTGAYSLLRNLWTSLTGNALTRHVFPDAISFMNRMSDGGLNPIYYVSSSPWNLHHFLEQIFDRSGLVRGPKFLRDLGISETQFISGTHGDHKGASIDAIINGSATNDIILVGDTGQHDPFVYRDAIKRHPNRIKYVVLRQVGGSPNAKVITATKDIAALGVPVLRGSSFAGFAETINAQ